MSNLLTKILLIEYVIIMVVCIFERNWPKSLYFGGACILQVSVLWGMK